MQLTRHTDYALRVLIHLAVNKDKLITATKLAEFYGISRHHLVKVVQGLVQHQFVKTTQGKHGGMQLAQDAKDISVGHVVRLMENHFNIVECFDADNNNCSLDGACNLKAVLKKATKDFLSTLDAISIADINKPKLRKHIINLQ